MALTFECNSRTSRWRSMRRDRTLKEQSGWYSVNAKMYSSIQALTHVRKEKNKKSISHVTLIGIGIGIGRVGGDQI